jgi:hypothetical protein
MYKLVIFLIVIVSAQSCIKQTKEDYECQCTYTPIPLSPSEGLPVKVEFQTINTYNSIGALEKCQDSKDKYNQSYFTGVCLVN